MTINFDSIPKAMITANRWVLWKYEIDPKNGKLTKVPYQPDGEHASTASSLTWSNFEAVKATYEQGGYDGIGFVLGAGFVGIDFDHKCAGADTSRVIDGYTREDLMLLDSYTEISPSGKGIHVICFGEFPEDGRKDQAKGIEAYAKKRFFTVTGDRLDGYPEEPQHRTDELLEFYKKYFLKESKPEKNGLTSNTCELTDDQVIELASREKNGDRFLSLMDGKYELFLKEDGTRRYPSQSEADLGLCEKIAFYTKNPEQIARIFKKSELSKREKCEGREDYLPRTIEKAIERTPESYDGLGSVKANAELSKANDILKTLPDRIKADPRAIKEIEIIKALAAIRVSDPIEYDLTIGEIKRAQRDLKVDTINGIVDEWIQKNSKTTEKIAEIPKDIKEKALAISTKGNPLKFLIWQAQRNHLGDIDYQKVLIASIASAASETSNGIQPGGNGDKGSGKSDACTATYHLVPLDRRLDGSLSPMSLFYLQQSGRLKPGMILFSDDVEYEPIIPIYKRATARFQQGITHFTVSGGKNREALELHMPPRMVWWLTSVESVANEQAFDRQYPISTDSSPDHKKRVAKEIAARRARKELKLAEDEGIEVARAVIEDIFDNGPFKVYVPQATKAEWLKVSDFRGQEQFWDLVDALCILRWRQRSKTDDGWLIAEDQDLIEAKNIHSGHKVAHFADLTDAEVKVVGALMDGLPHTQKQLTEVLEIAQSTLSERLKSIMSKSAIITEDFDSGKKIYSLNPNMQIGKDYWDNIDLINLKIDGFEAYRSLQIALSSCYRFIIGLPIGIIINNSNRIPSSLSVKKEESIEDICPCDQCLGWTNDLSFSLSPANNTDNDQKEQQEPLSDTDKTGDNSLIDTDNAISKPSDIPIRQSGDVVNVELRQTEDRAAAKEERDRELVAKHTKPDDLAVLVSMNTPYETDLPDIDGKIKMVELNEGDELLVSYDRARYWVKRGVAKVIELALICDQIEAAV